MFHLVILKRYMVVPIYNVLKYRNMFDFKMSSPSGFDYEIQ